jgi:regulator of replication initiation timing
MRNRVQFLTLSAILIMVFSFGIGVAYLRIQSTLIGYQLGELKDRETALLEQRSRLKMELAKLTKKENLTILASDKSNSQQNRGKTLASR